MTGRCFSYCPEFSLLTLKNVIFSREMQIMLRRVLQFELTQWRRAMSWLKMDGPSLESDQDLMPAAAGPNLVPISWACIFVKKSKLWRPSCTFIWKRFNPAALLLDRPTIEWKWEIWNRIRAMSKLEPKVQVRSQRKKTVPFWQLG